MLCGCWGGFDCYDHDFSWMREQATDPKRDASRARFASRNTSVQTCALYVRLAYSKYGIDSDKSLLQRQARWLNRSPAVRVTIKGHFDERGTRAYNLSARRTSCERSKRVLRRRRYTQRTYSDSIIWEGTSSPYLAEWGWLVSKSSWCDDNREWRHNMNADWSGDAAPHIMEHMNGEQKVRALEQLRLPFRRHRRAMGKAELR